MTRFCIEPGCLKTAVFNHPGDLPMFCKLHTDFEGGMVNVKNKRCKKCIKIARVDGLCVSCARKDGWEEKVNQKMCPCGKQVQVDGLCISCARKNGWKGKMKKKMCPCGKRAHADELCMSCYNELQGIVRNPSEIAFKNFLKNKFPQYELKTEFYILGYQIDFLMEMVEMIIAIEYDQDQHKTYNPEKERKRETEIFQKLSSKKRTVLIRFNPSKYKVGKKIYNPSMEQRLEKLEEMILECIQYKNKSGIFKLFYDE